MSYPHCGCRWINRRSTSPSRPRRVRIFAGMKILPMSWRCPATRGPLIRSALSLDAARGYLGPWRHASSRCLRPRAGEWSNWARSPKHVVVLVGTAWSQRSMAAAAGARSSGSVASRKVWSRQGFCYESTRRVVVHRSTHEVPFDVVLPHGDFARSGGEIEACSFRAQAVIS